MSVWNGVKGNNFHNIHILYTQQSLLFLIVLIHKSRKILLSTNTVFYTPLKKLILAQVEIQFNKRRKPVFEHGMLMKCDTEGQQS